MHIVSQRAFITHPGVERKNNNGKFQVIGDSGNHKHVRHINLEDYYSSVVNALLVLLQKLLIFSHGICFQTPYIYLITVVLPRLVCYVR